MEHKPDGDATEGMEEVKPPEGAEEFQNFRGKRLKRITPGKPLAANELGAVFSGVFVGFETQQKYGNDQNILIFEDGTRIYSTHQLDIVLVHTYPKYKGKLVGIEYLGKKKSDSGNEFHDFEIYGED